MTIIIDFIYKYLRNDCGLIVSHNIDGYCILYILYTFGLLEFFSLSLIAGNWFMGLLCLIGVIIFRLIVIPKEEAHLIAVFDQEYERYRARTGALIPRI